MDELNDRDNSMLITDQAKEDYFPDATARWCNLSKQTWHFRTWEKYSKNCQMFNEIEIMKQIRDIQV